MIFGRPSPGKS